MKIKETILILCFLVVMSLIGYYIDLNPARDASLLCNKAINRVIAATKESSKKANTVKENQEAKNIKKAKPKKPEVLKIGSKGERVKKLQEKLNKFGYNLAVDGIFGVSTEIALYDFQIRNKINTTKIADDTTLAKLNLPPTKETMYNPPSSNSAEVFINKINSYSDTNYYIWVDTNNTKVYIFEGHSKCWKLKKEMLCTVGAPSSPTIKGAHKVGIKGESFIVKDNPSIKCSYFTQINGDYLFHSILLFRNGGIADGRLGQKLSHGCVRLSIENAKYIYDNIPKNTGIYIN